MALFGVLVTTLAACGVEPVATSNTTQAIEDSNKISANKISANKISANKISANKISANKISANKISANMLAAADLLSTADGREVYSYIISCALPAEQTVEAVVAGVTYDFVGGLGLAPAWSDRPATGSERRWVSACLFARVNAYDISVEISMRGDNDGLAVSPAERRTYPLEEGAFYGNLFTPDDAPIQWFACRGRDQARGESGGLVNRDCAEPSAANDGTTTCGFTYAGDCGSFFHQARARACEDFADGGYQGCHSPNRQEWDEVITTFVTR
jgi:hypothetical protein